jgi:hypothetical protein
MTEHPATPAHHCRRNAPASHPHRDARHEAGVWREMRRGARGQQAGGATHCAPHSREQHPSEQTALPLLPPLPPHYRRKPINPIIINSPPTLGRSRTARHNTPPCPRQPPGQSPHPPCPCRCRSLAHRGHHRPPSSCPPSYTRTAPPQRPRARKRSFSQAYFRQREPAGFESGGGWRRPCSTAAVGRADADVSYTKQLLYSRRAGKTQVDLENGGEGVHAHARRDGESARARERERERERGRQRP